MDFKYKNADFYNAYCEQLKDFVLLEYFEDMKENYVGKLLAKNTIHKLEIVVRIPKTFPHNKLYFYTSSLFGYPHLIPCFDSIGRSWFCLNSAFAETARGQLNEEFDRLRGWIKEQMRPELPAVIADIDTRRALSVFNTYAKGNADEMNELNAAKEDLIFAGDIWKNVENEREGYLDCVKQRNGKYIVYDGTGTTDKLPFVIVDHQPKDWSSFASLVAEFGWSDEFCERLLPNFNWGKMECEGKFVCKEGNEPHTEHPRKENIETDYRYLCQQLEHKDIPEKYKTIIRERLKTFVKESCNACEYKTMFSTNMDVLEDYGFDPEEEYRRNSLSLHHFALGVVYEGKLKWYLIDAQQCNVKYEELTIDLGRYEYRTKHVQDIPLKTSIAKRIKYDEFYGRGCLATEFTNKKILLIGLGAIGSFLAETLVRGGIRNITLSDGDYVEAGNLCRASFEMNSIGDSKASALADKLQRISPFCVIKEEGKWDGNGLFLWEYKHGEFYGNVNYDSQEKFLKRIEKYDLIIDCTASNELLHFLSYAVKKPTQLISVCITNHAKDCLFLSNTNGNVFEQRKHILAKIEQDTDNFYVAGTGCYAPTFLATASDMLPFTNLIVRKINKSLASSMPITSTVWHYQEDSILAESVHTYRIENGSIRLVVLQSVMDSIRQSVIFEDGQIGILMGGYSSDGTHIFITHVVGMQKIQNDVEKIKKVSQNVLDYIGNVCVSGVSQKHLALLKQIAIDCQINTNNPLLAQLKEDGSVAFYLLIEDDWVPFIMNDVIC